MKKIMILFGGASSEYPVSLQSATAVLKHIDRKKYHVLPVGITRAGEWFLYHGEIDKIAADIWHQDNECCQRAYLLPDKKEKSLLVKTEREHFFIKIDAVFPVLHGKNGEDGTIQGLVELAGIPLIGCGTLASALCMDKHRAHLLVETLGISIPKAVLLSKYDCIVRHNFRGLIHTETDINEQDIINKIQDLGLPLFVKPLRSGSSFGISKITDYKELISAMETAFAHDDTILIEEAIDGFEVGCAIIGKDTLTTGRVDEIELSEGFFDYTEKYHLTRSHIYMPARIRPEKEREIQTLAEKIYRILGCSGFARVDMFLTKEENIVFNEVNTIPGFTDHSRFPNMMKGIGLSFPEMLDKIIEVAVDGK